MRNHTKMKNKQKEREEWNKYFGDAHINQHDRDKAWSWIEKALSKREANIEAYLLQGFNDYENPLDMDAEYVRNRIIELIKEFNE